MANRRLLLRYGAVGVCGLIFTAWYLGWWAHISHHQRGDTKTLLNSALQQNQITTRDPSILPIVYLDKHIQNKTKLLKSQPIIPRIIHQTWKGHDIPATFVPLVRTWPKVNPDYEYWIWTDADADRFIRLRFPQYYDMYKSYPQNIHRADAMRYFILWEYGGWYVDMDVEAIKPIDEFSRSHNCVVSQEPWAHTKFYWNKDRLACNALMGARPKHPLFDLIIKTLPERNKQTSKGDVMGKTGPKMVDSLVTSYEQKFKDMYSSNMTVYLASPDAFLPTVAANALAAMKKACTKRQRSAEKQKICDEFIRTNFANKVPDTAYTNHVWVHTYYGIDEKKNENIFMLIPKAKNVKEMLDKLEKELSSNTERKKLGRGF